jgi:hypothetical protein
VRGDANPDDTKAGLPPGGLHAAPAEQQPRHLPVLSHPSHHLPAPGGRVGKNPFFYKPSPADFLGFFLVFWFFGFFFVFLYIFAQKREFLGFFQFQEYF